jgi:transposase
MRGAATAPILVDADAVCAELAALLADGKSADALERIRQVLLLLRDRFAHQELEIGRLLRKQMGRTSERVSEAQLSLLVQLLGEQAGQTTPEPALPPPAAELPDSAVPKPDKKKGHGRGRLPAHLRREPIVHPVPAEERACPICGEARDCIGYEISEVLRRRPAEFWVEEHQREKLACRPCDQGVAIGPVPDKVIAKGRPGPDLLAQVIVAKYADHLPLNRQRAMYLREGVDLPVSTLADWVAAFHQTVVPLVMRLGDRVLGAHLVNADDTGIKVLDRDAPGGAKKGHLWCYVGDARDLIFRYTPDWSKEGPQSFLATRRGWLQADAYRGYDGLFNRADATAVEVACWAHGRRPFAELALEGDARAAPMIQWCQKLYAIEAQATADGVSTDERLARRQAESTPLVDAISAWCAVVRGRYPPSDPLARAAGYVINQNRALRRFLEDGRLPLDNTLVERRLRSVATGRKNYLFCGSDTAGDRAASAYTLLGCCALIGIDPLAYLTWLLTQLATGTFRAARIDDLLPATWAETCPPEARISPSR